MIAHEKGFKFHAQPQTGAYSCLISVMIVYTYVLRDMQLTFVATYVRVK